MPPVEGPLSHDDPLGFTVKIAIHTGDLEGLRRLLDENPGLASVKVLGRKEGGGWGTPLHMVTDWPGYFPEGPPIVAMLVAAGADPNVDTGGGAPETPLHWAASSDDVDVAAALIDAGARLDTPGGSIGTPLDNAVGYCCWHVARLLVERGAPVEKLWHAAALGLLAGLDELLAADPPPDQQALDQAFWHACSGGQLRAAQRLLAAGAAPDASPEYANGQTPLEAAGGGDTRRGQLVEWLRSLAVTAAAE